MIEYSSFRDSSGFVFQTDGTVKRQINSGYLATYRKLIGSGLYRTLVHSGLLIPHKELEEAPPSASGALVIRPLKIPMVSYPYEWSFGMLRDAALTTLQIHRTALNFGMVLKHASAYNIQFLSGQPMLIDTLSFDSYQEDRPWEAYGQFCRHFLAPLFLMRHTDIRLNQLLRVYIDGIPLDLAARLLNGKGGAAARLHIAWHAKASAVRRRLPGRGILPLFRQIELVEHLLHTVESMTPGPIDTRWADYDSTANYAADAEQSKTDAIDSLLNGMEGKTVWDFGANDGKYTRLALKNRAALAVAFDLDPAAVERNYNTVKESGENLLPLLLDLTNPSPSIGFANRERPELSARGTPDCILMLALIHHLAISNNLPFAKIAEWLASLTGRLVIEFIPKEDLRVCRLLAHRPDIFSDYHREAFESEFKKFFQLEKSIPLTGSDRILYLFTHS